MTLRVPLTERRSNQWVLKEITSEYSLKGLMLKLKLQYFGHLMRKTDIGKDHDAGKNWRQEEKGTRGWDSWMASRTGWTWVWANSGRWWWTGKPAVLQSKGSQRVGHDWVTEQQQAFQHVVVFTHLETLQSPWLLGFYRNALTRARSSIDSMPSSSALSWEWGGWNCDFQASDRSVVFPVGTSPNLGATQKPT